MAITIPWPDNETMTVNTYAADGVTITWPVNFVGGYLVREVTPPERFVKVVIRNDATQVDTEYPLTNDNWVTNSSIRISPAVATGNTIFIMRHTPRDFPMVDYQVRGMLRASELNMSQAQAINLGSEIADRLRMLVADTQVVSVQIADILAQITSIKGDITNHASQILVLQQTVISIRNTAELALAKSDQAAAAANEAKTAAQEAKDATAVAVAQVAAMQAYVDEIKQLLEDFNATGLAELAAKVTEIEKFYIRKDGTIAMTGELTLSGNPTRPLSAVTKQYVDAGEDTSHAEAEQVKAWVSFIRIY